MIHERNIVVAYIFWLILGILGAHKFYLKQPLMGVIYFFTAGLLLIGWFIDLFTLPEQVDEFNDQLYLQEDENYLEDRIEELEDEVDRLRDRLRETQ